MNLYIDDQPFEGFGEFTPPEVEQANAELKEAQAVAWPAAFECAVEATKEAVCKIRRAAAVLGERIGGFWRALLDMKLRKINPRWYHLYKHSKSGRIRKKNHDRLMREYYRQYNIGGRR